MSEPTRAELAPEVRARWDAEVGRMRACPPGSFPVDLAVADHLSAVEAERDALRLTHQAMVRFAEMVEGQRDQVRAERDRLVAESANLDQLCLRALLERDALAGQVARLLDMIRVDGRLGEYLNTMVADCDLLDRGDYLRDLFGRLAAECAALAAAPEGTR